jgi:hypothetical protein
MSVPETLPGILAIWNDCAPGHEAEFEQWYQHEHLEERIAIPGFLVGRRYEAVSGAPRYFAFYLTQSPAVLKSPAYLERLDNPTPLTRKIMSGLFRNANRTVCEQSVRLGAIRGAAAVTLRFDQRPEMPALEAAIRTLMQDKAVACADIWSAVSDEEFPVSEEERVRGGDRKIATCLVVETLRISDAEAIAKLLSRQFPAAEAGVYRLLCEIRPT